MIILIQLLGVVSLTLILRKVYDLYYLRKPGLDFLHLIEKPGIEGLDDMLRGQQLWMESLMSWIPSIGNDYILLGFINVIRGMFVVMKSTSTTDPVLRTEFIQQGLELAIHSLAYSLGVTLVSLVAYSVLTNRINVLSQDLVRRSMDIIQRKALK